MSDRYDLLENASADSGSFVVHPGGRFVWSAVATWSTHSLKLQMRMPDGATFADIPGCVLDANTASMTIDLQSGATVKAVLVGTPTGIYSTLVRV